MKRRSFLGFGAGCVATLYSSCPTLADERRAMPAISAVLRDSVWGAAAGAAGVVDPLIVYAVALYESGATDDHGGMAPYPWTLCFAGADVRLPSRHDAEQALRGIGPRTNVDIGLMQVNWAAHGYRVSGPGELLEPERNVRLGGELLGEALRSAPEDFVLGLGRYHSWHEGRARDYGSAVWRLYMAMRPIALRRRERLA